MGRYFETVICTLEKVTEPIQALVSPSVTWGHGRLKFVKALRRLEAKAISRLRERGVNFLCSSLQHRRSGRCREKLRARKRAHARGGPGAGAGKVITESVLRGQRGRKLFSRNCAAIGVAELVPHPAGLRAAEGRRGGLRGPGQGKWRLAQARELLAPTAATFSIGSALPCTTR